MREERETDLLHTACVGHRGIVHAEASHGSVKLVEELLGDESGDGCPHAAALGGLVKKDDLSY